MGKLMIRHQLRVRPATAILALAALVLLLMPVTSAQTEPPPDGAANDDQPLKEQSIYIPYKKLREVFEREGRGVFLPYEQFLALWKAAHERPDVPSDAGPPIDALITETANEATVSADVVQVIATVRIELLGEGWMKVPLRLDDTAITRATIGDAPARIVRDRRGGYELLYERAADGPRAIDLELEYAKAFARSPGRNSVSFNAPQAPISRWRVTIPEPGVKVNLQPLIAATEVPSEGEEGVEGGETVVLAFVGAAPVVGIDWTPRSEGATGLEALANVRATQQVWIEEGVTRTRADLEYAISRAVLTALTLQVPGDQKVVNIADANVRQWSVEAVDDVQRIDVQLFEPADSAQNVRVELEKYTPEQERTALSVPIVQALDVARQQGVLAVRAAEGLRVEVTRVVGLMQMDAGELPASLKEGAWDFAYGYSALPSVMELAVEKIQPFITVSAMVAAGLQPEELTLDYAATFNIERAGVFQLELDVPADCDVRQVRGVPLPGANPAEIDTHHVEGDEGTRLVINLSRKAIGKVGLAFQLVRRLTHPQLLTPMDEAASIELPIPRVAPEMIDRETGQIVVYAPESLQVNAKESEGLRSISPGQAMSVMEVPPAPGTSGRPVLSFQFAQDAVKLVLEARRRQPYVTAGQLLTARIEPGVVKFEATFNYEVLYSPVESLRIDVPSGIASLLHNVTADVRERTIEPSPADLAEGYVAWSFAGSRPFLGKTQITLSWEQKLDNLDVGKSVDINIPRLAPSGVDRAWGQVVLSRSETIDVQPTGEPAGVRPIDPQHDLMAGVKAPDAARAFEFQDDWELKVAATHYELEKVKRTSVERALVRVVMTRSDQMSVQALYRMRSARQRLLMTLPTGVEFDTQPLHINGLAVPLERGEAGKYYAPLASQDPDEPFVLEMRYTLPEADGPIEFTVFPEEPAVQKVYVSAYLPHERALLGSRGPWSEEMDWRRRGLLNWTPIPTTSESRLIQWVSEGVNLPGNIAGSFPTDGTRYLFSALRPAAPPAGSLTISTMNSNWLSTLTFIIIVLGGAALLRMAVSLRWLAVGAFITLLVLLGVFAPTFSLQVMDGVTVAAVLIVLLMWLVRYFAWTRPRDPGLQALRAARHEAALAQVQAALAPAVVPPPPAPPPPHKKDQGAADKPQDGGHGDA